MPYLFGFVILAGIALLAFVTFTELNPDKTRLPMQSIALALVVAGSAGLMLAL
jgi:hypothetical protein